MSGRTLSKIFVLTVRLCVSVTVTGKDFMPVELFAGTTAAKLNTLPEPPNDWLGDPPICERSAVTVTPVLAGF